VLAVNCVIVGRCNVPAAAPDVTTMLSEPPRAVICRQIAIKSPLAIVLLPVVGTLVFQVFCGTPPPPPVNDAATSKLITSVVFDALAGGPAAVSTAAMPTLNVVPALANVLPLARHPIDDDPVVSMVCEPPSEVTA